jgi:hypothetical protein
VGRVRVMAVVARAGVLAGGLVSSVGAGLALGAAAGLVAGGAVLAVWCLFVADVGHGEGGGRDRA